MIQVKDFAHHTMLLCHSSLSASGVRQGGLAMQKKVTWILVADGARARVLMNDGIGKGLQAAVNGEMVHALPG